MRFMCNSRVIFGSTFPAQLFPMHQFHLGNYGTHSKDQTQILPCPSIGDIERFVLKESIGTKLSSKIILITSKVPYKGVKNHFL